MQEQIKTETFEIYKQAFKVDYTFENNGCILNEDSVVNIKTIQPAPDEEDFGWIRERLEDCIRFHELEDSFSNREFQKHFREEMISDESRGN